MPAPVCTTRDPSRFRVTPIERMPWKAACIPHRIENAMPDTKQQNQPLPESGYPEQQDSRGQPGEDQTKGGRQLPEETAEDPRNSEDKRGASE